MASAKDILNERLARGEITPDEHERLSAHLRSHEPPKASAQLSDAAKDFTLPKGSWFIGFVCIVGGIGLFRVGSNVKEEILASCRKAGNSFDFCYQHGINWPIVYLWYALTAIMVMYGIAKLALPKD
jgi:hypothetical protein